MTLRPLLDYLAAAQPAAAGPWAQWQVAPVGGGANNLLYRARDPDHDLAIKFTIRDERDRAGREYAALCALRDAGLALAPDPVLLDRDRYACPVVVQTWLEGPVAADPPGTDAGWGALLDHYATIHHLTPATLPSDLRPAVLSMTSATTGQARIHEQLSRIPPVAWPDGLAALVQRADTRAFPTWPPPRPCFCRCDSNTLNFIRRPAAWASVDWENSGWGDGAFEIADLMAHPQYQTVPPARWEWVSDTYCALRGERAAADRIRVYYVLTLLWWVVRFARALYEIPRGRDARLVARPAGWQDVARLQYDRYLARAGALLDS
ncbi:MAG TPA: aminoglycoside phosphotransferase family protein [Chloroflexia bacterium]|nr:aminoglycoside phosphotransferase family protein [Chloroflexia bacterium]